MEGTFAAEAHYCSLLAYADQPTVVIDSNIFSGAEASARRSGTALEIQSRVLRRDFVGAAQRRTVA